MNATTQPPATETAPDASPCAPVLSAAHVSAAGSTSVTDLLAHLRDVSRLREARMAELERVRALRGAR